jgi:DNA-binding CsgD family transcriptional regulator/pentose-5-phosphate-3-epimerase
MTAAKKLPNIIYYDDAHTSTVEPTIEFSQQIGATWSSIKTWAELASEIEMGAKYIMLHVDMLTRSVLSVQEFISAIKTIHTVAKITTPLHIGVIITPTTSRLLIDQLQQANILGVGPSCIHYSVEQVAQVCADFLAGRPFWPEFIIDNLPPARPISIYFREDWKPYVANLDLTEFDANVEMEIAYCSNWHELNQLFSKSPHQIVVHIDTVRRLDITIFEIVSMIKTRFAINGIDIPIGVGIEPNTPVSTIRELKQAGVLGIVPSVAHWGVDTGVTALHALRDRLPHWPKHIIGQLPGNTPKKVKSQKSAIHISPRQQQVLNLIKTRGLGNKQIANALAISESTVKMHISDIMRAYGVKSRVQLILLA